MAEVLTAGQMQCIEQTAMAGDSVTGLELMEWAGQGVVDAVLERWPDLAAQPYKAVILCGPGNNGGDGFVIARLLKLRGWQVRVYLFGSPDRLPVDAAVNHDRWCALGPVGTSVTTSQEMLETQVSDCLFVDALFGTGLTRALPDPLAAFLAGVCGDASVRSVAVDIPSGLCADSGRMLRTAGRARGALAQFDLTVTFHRAKRGHLTQEGAMASGALALVDIGLDGAHAEISQTLTRDAQQHPSLGQIAHWVGLEDPALAALATKSPSAHKFSHGHAVVFAGGACKTGAARLAARGALRVGAGLVTLAVPDAALGEVAAQVTAIMIAPVNDPHEVAAMLQDRRFNAVCLGPGLGLDRARALVPVALDQIGSGRRAAVLDADALTGFADAPDDLFALLHRDCVLTPHFGEFSRLFPDLADKLLAEPTQGPAYSRYDAVCSAAARAGCTVLLKGPDTVIGCPDGRLSVNASLYQDHAPWLATAGSGDVLAGYITGLLARGVPALQAAELGAWLHAQCGRCFGPGLIAEDLPEQLPKVFQDLSG